MRLNAARCLHRLAFAVGNRNSVALDAVSATGPRHGSIIRCLRHKTSEDNLKVGKSHRSIVSKVRFALLRRFIAARDARFSTVSSGSERDPLVHIRRKHSQPRHVDTLRQHGYTDVRVSDFWICIKDTTDWSASLRENRLPQRVSRS